MPKDSNPPLYFHCNMCGECCSSWNIPIEGHKAEILLTRPWVQARLTATRRELVKLADDFYRIPLTDENVCVFLADDKRCLIEANEGLTLKPHECQRFPFATVKMPDGTARHESSAACKLISEKLLLAFQPVLPKPATEPTLPPLDNTQFEEVGEVPSRIPTGIWRTISVEQYETFQTHLKALFSHSDAPPIANLKQTQRLLKALPAQKTLPLTSQQSETFQVPVWKAALLCLCFLRKPYRTLSWFSLLWGKPYHDPRLFGVPVQLSQQRQIPWNPEHNRHLNAFVFNILQRKRVLCSQSSLSALLAMASVACLLVQWYARTLAWFQESREISAMDVATAIRLVERYYTGHQPRFMEFFLSRWRGKLLERFLFQ